MDRGERRHRDEKVVRRREQLSRAKRWDRDSSNKKRGKFRKSHPEHYRCDCDNCQWARTGGFPPEQTDA